MKTKFFILLFMAATLSSCYRGDGSIGLSGERLDFDAEGGSKELSYKCIMGIDFGYEVKEGVSTSNTAEIYDNENNDIFYLKDTWVSAEFNRDSKIIDVVVLPNDSKDAREYKIAIWCADTRGYIDIYQQGRSD